MKRNTKLKFYPSGGEKHRFRYLGLIGALAFLGTACFALTANAADETPALKTHFGINYQATGFWTQSQVYETKKSDDKDNGFAQLLRLSADFLNPGTGISVHTKLDITHDRWYGDERPDRADDVDPLDFNRGSRGDLVRMEQAYVQIPFYDNLLRVGRQEASWDNCFLVCKDPRDRILLIHNFTTGYKFTGILGYDRRQDAHQFENGDNGDQFFLGAILPVQNWTIGLLYVHWINHSEKTNPTHFYGNGYPLTRVDLYSPYIEGNLGPLDVKGGFTYVTNGRVHTPVPRQIFGGHYDGSGWSEYLRLGADFGGNDGEMFKLQAQFVGVEHGGLISDGFDSFSSMINNNPDSKQNPTSVYSMDGVSYLGAMDNNQQLYIARLTINATDKLKLMGSAGALHVHNGTRGVYTTLKSSDTSGVFDLQAHYQFNKILRAWVTAGYMTKNKAAVLTGNGLIGTPPMENNGLDHGVFAGSVNLGVKF